MLDADKLLNTMQEKYKKLIIKKEVCETFLKYSDELNIEIVKQIDNFYEKLSESERLIIIPWFEDNDKKSAIQFVVLDEEYEEPKMKVQLMISFHLDDKCFYSSSSGLKHYFVRETWVEYLEKILGFKPKVFKY